MVNANLALVFGAFFLAVVLRGPGFRNASEGLFSWILIGVITVTLLGSNFLIHVPVGGSPSFSALFMFSFAAVAVGMEYPLSVFAIIAQLSFIVLFLMR